METSPRRDNSALISHGCKAAKEIQKIHSFTHGERKGSFKGSGTRELWTGDALFD
jgi:hypothetical protein